MHGDQDDENLSMAANPARSVRHLSQIDWNSESGNIRQIIRYSLIQKNIYYPDCVFNLTDINHQKHLSKPPAHPSSHSQIRRIRRGISIRIDFHQSPVIVMKLPIPISGVLLLAALVTTSLTPSVSANDEVVSK